MKKIKTNIRWLLVFYDILILLFTDTLLLFLYRSNGDLSYGGVIMHTILSVVCMFVVRLFVGIYQQIWRYGGVQCYLRLMFADGCAFIVNLFIERTFLAENIMFSNLLAIYGMNLLGTLAVRMIYRYAYINRSSDSVYDRMLNVLLRIFSRSKAVYKINNDDKKIKIAIIGAGRVGTALAEELINNPSATYVPRCFVDISKEKINREIHGITVLMENEKVFEQLERYEVQEVIFAIPILTDKRKKEMYELYTDNGYKVKVYDRPVMSMTGGKRYVRDFDIEELLFRKPVVIQNSRTFEYYGGKVVLITGGGGSIGSELCRQLAKMSPKQIIILDIYENGAYDVQQELKILYGNSLDLRVEIASITNLRAMLHVFEEYRPQVVIHAAAHKHVPLMENNCVEAVENNVFGTKLIVDLCEKYGAERFMMVSTDKAVNPTNIMGATKRMCEMIVQSASTTGSVKYSSTRFGNVLGSAGSVIPLFKKQIMSGGPITVTDKRIIRYFMTIPEASQLVLQSGAMAENGELFVLDMGKPVKIMELAESMIRLSGVNGIEIVETGLRPGEKLYEELLVDTEKMEKTENSLIFIEHDTPCSEHEIEFKLKTLREACDSNDNDAVRSALKAVVPTYTPFDAPKDRVN